MTLSSLVMTSSLHMQGHDLEFAVAKHSFLNFCYALKLGKAEITWIDVKFISQPLCMNYLIMGMFQGKSQFSTCMHGESILQQFAIMTNSSDTSLAVGLDQS